jgi:hypothetical protein
MFPLVYFPSLDFEIKSCQWAPPFQRNFIKLAKKTVPGEDTIMSFSLFAKISKHNMAGYKLVMYKWH